ncbi:MAG: UDP-N-acetylmuramate--L-alanine ligase [Candidatus Omnitrophica bacterium]|nr:UDP-N-acetylmuramate--L-alanine ligase [Candidatus Omnitrophota bacterium]
MINRLSDNHQIQNARSAYFIGIGGAGMSALAKLLHHNGVKVSGSDLKETLATRQLLDLGISVYIGQEEPHFDPAVDLVVYSSAIHENHVEFAAAKQFGRNIFHRAAVLSSFFNSANISVAITGTHGKTTTSAMVSFVLHDRGKDPTCLIGGDLVDFGTNALLGHSGIYVSEVDESDKTHELFAPNYAIVTNLEEDHVDHYTGTQDLQDSFQRFLQNLHDPGLVVYSEDDPDLKNLSLKSGKPHLSFGFSSAANFSAQNIRLAPSGTIFDLYVCGVFSTEFRLCLIGLHNVSNALASIALLHYLGLDLDSISESLSRFHGATRRLEVKYQSDHLMIINDYAHNPTKVLASIKALRVYNRKLTVIFQPHRYTRTQRFFKEFAHALRDTDDLILTDIYGAGENNETHISTQKIHDELIRLGHPSVHFIAKEKVSLYLSSRLNLSGVVAFLGAGDIGDLANEFSDRHKTTVTA